MLFVILFFSSGTATSANLFFGDGDECKLTETCGEALI